MCYLCGILFAMKQKISIIQSQRAILAPVMQKSISVLLMPIIELSTAIDQELQENPLLELEEPQTEASAAQDSTSTSTSEEPQIIENFSQKILELAEIRSDNTYNSPNEDDETSEKPISKGVSLEEYLLQQLHIEITDPLKQKIGEQIIGNIDENGYVKITCEEIEKNLGLSEKNLIEEVLLTIQGFDPIGIASRDLKECLLAQLRYQVNPLDETTISVVQNHLEELGKKKYAEIGRKLGVCPEKIEQIAHHIAALEPKPARKYNPIETNLYVKPDIFIRTTDEGCQILVNNDGLPRLRINPFYREMLSRKDLNEKEKQFIKQHFENALNFLKSIKQREETLTAIVKFIIEKQSAFFMQDYESIVPLTLKEVATAVDRDESTVSRAIRHKYMDTPHGIYPLKFFFSNALPQENGEGPSNISTHTIKEELKTLIDEEDKNHPLNDQAIQRYFEQKGISIARRTVAKYRQQLYIPPAQLRKNQ